jgi:Bacillus/Clostridium GerA spore germination protein.
MRLGKGFKKVGEFNKNKRLGKSGRKQAGSTSAENDGNMRDISRKPLRDSLEANIAHVRRTTGGSPDVVVRKFVVGRNPGVVAAALFVDGLVEDKNVYDFVLEPLLQPDIPPQTSGKDLLDFIENSLVAVSGVERVSDWSEFFSGLMEGSTMLMLDGVSLALKTGTQGGQFRSIEEPTSQLAVRGPREGFTESLRMNTAMVRRYIRNPYLWQESMVIGEATQTRVSVMYIQGIANDKVVEEVRRRLKQIKADSILESGYIEQFIEDKTFTLFPTVYHTERPDIVAANLLEGRIAIFVDGTPFVLVVPALFIQFFHAVEDYYYRFDIASALRFLRVLIFFLSLVAPSAYVAATTFHQEMIPSALVLSLAAQREAVPFPAFIEVLVMEIAFEILREAGVRLPRQIGQAISIVGALVIGQAAVEAGFVSTSTVIVVSITAIASFATPTVAIATSARIIRFVFIVISSMFGFYGLVIGLLFMTLHLCSLRSFGVPYMSPLAPMIPSNAGDTILRKPIWAWKERPRLISQNNIIRQEPYQRPMPPHRTGDTPPAGTGDKSPANTGGTPPTKTMEKTPASSGDDKGENGE